MNGSRYAEAAVVALVMRWLAAGLLARPAAFGAVALLALLPLALVVLPLLVSLAFAERSMTARRSDRPGRLRDAAVTDGTTRARVRPRPAGPDDDGPQPSD